MKGGKRGKKKSHFQQTDFLKSLLKLFVEFFCIQTFFVKIKILTINLNA